MSDKRQALANAYVELASSLTRAANAADAYARELGVASAPAQLEALVANPPNLPFYGAKHGSKAAAAHAAAGSDEEEDGEGKGKKKLKVKKVKDPNAPKRPASAYIEFQNSVRDEFRQADPEATYQEILRKISGVWQAMPDHEKKRWNDITAEKTIEYEKAKRNYKPVEGAEAAAAIPAVITVGKDGKEYTGKKRGRKSNAEKAAEAAHGLVDTNGNIDVATGGILASGSGDKKKTPKSSKKQKDFAPVSSDSDESESDSDDSSEEEEEEVAPPPKKSPISKKGKALPEHKPKSKKAKH
ncbi:BQ2448_428 [Microbotryum intermedium]|uniref:BQ2448_428 protein n=1 Tax=Microbotryum intermedium TaxID=269621 RepID=A0A238F5J3_9BASI|nr:BQ2448_428 [Microbotryum intermedium]